MVKGNVATEEKVEEATDEQIESLNNKNLNNKNVTKKKQLNKNNSKSNKTKKNNISITRIFAYFVIYSIIGYILETIFALITKGVLESRKSFLYGPFCAIYGLGATTMIIGLQKFNKNNYTLFFGGVLIGSIVEYLVSLIGELIFKIKWWDYSSMPFNLNGRICLGFSIMWGILAIYLMSHFNPKIDKLLDKVPPKVLKICTIIFVVFLFLDWLISSFAVQMFYARLSYQKNVELQQSNILLEKCNKLYTENETINKIVNTLFPDEFIIKSFPNLKVTNRNGEIILVHNFFPEIRPYYIKLFTHYNS